MTMTLTYEHDSILSTDPQASSIIHANLSMMLACSFGKLHPALADKHYLRTSDENERIHTARFRMQQGQDAKERSSATRPSTAGAAAGLTKSRRSSTWAALKQV